MLTLDHIRILWGPASEALPEAFGLCVRGTAGLTHIAHAVQCCVCLCACLVPCYFMHCNRLCWYTLDAAQATLVGDVGAANIKPALNTVHQHCNLPPPSVRSCHDGLSINAVAFTQNASCDCANASSTVNPFGTLMIIWLVIWRIRLSTLRLAVE